MCLYGVYVCVHVCVRVHVCVCMMYHTYTLHTHAHTHMDPEWMCPIHYSFYTRNHTIKYHNYCYVMTVPSQIKLSPSLFVLKLCSIVGILM